MNWKLLLLAMAVAGAVVAGVLLRTTEPRFAEAAYELTILHTNDLHAHYDAFEPWGSVLQGGVARLKTAIDEIENQAETDVLLLDAGDQFQGTLYFTVGGAAVVADVMNELGYDAMCIGNHEFDAGPAELAAFMDSAFFPVLSANVDAFGDPHLSGKVFPYAVFNFDGERVGVIGLTTEDTAITSSPGPNVHFSNAIECVQRAVLEMEAAGIHRIIALTHLGHSRDLELARSTVGIDVVVGGHSHTHLEEYPVVATSASGDPVLIVTADEWGKWLGRLDVTFTEDGLVDTYVGAPVFIDASIPEDPEMVELLGEYRPAIETLMTSAVGTTNVALNGAREDVRTRETNLGNLICDAMLWKTQGLETTIAIQNGGGVRATVPMGEVTMGQILEVLPYGNQITVLTLSGAKLAAALENGVSQVEDGSGRFPQVGGMRFTFDPEAPSGSRILSAEAWDAANTSYVALDPSTLYVVATNNFLAEGGDDYDAFAGAVDRYDTGWLLSDALAEYLGDMDAVSPAIEGRIQTPTADAESDVVAEPEATDTP